MGIEPTADVLRPRLTEPQRMLVYGAVGVPMTSTLIP